MVIQIIRKKIQILKCIKIPISTKSTEYCLLLSLQLPFDGVIDDVAA